ncbi:hypothetical protein TM49_00520 [Martelella endophytica]|uniref:Autotransporter domain-containing protein n=1 Tax=Martelella endophytica TaxID=1486262 RepID=A0A0D5LV39_MAREN|nr:hypothetical protein TM49_00520 [Martelella endophytica]
MLCSAAVLAGPAAAAPASAPVEAPKGSFRALTFNTWGDQFRNDLSVMSNFFQAGNYDIIGFQELRNDNYLTGLSGLFSTWGLGDYDYARQGDSGVLYRLDGTGGNTVVNGNGGTGVNVGYATLNAEDGRPATVFGSIHLDYRDPSNTRIQQAKNLNWWADQATSPLIITGDFNAGDVSERGLNRASQQKLMLRDYLRSNNSFYYQLMSEYTVDQQALDDYITAHRGQNVALTDIPDTFFEDEMYPIVDNTPVTLNILKKKYMFLVNAHEREIFQPLEAGDGITTWTSTGEDDTNTWPSWDHVQIDHFMASRPYGKWYVLADDPNDDYLGNLDDVGLTNSGQALSDHDTVGHTIRWVGPVLDDVEGNPAKKIVTWGADASTFGEEKTAYIEGDGKSETLDGKTFYLTRNNGRTDVRLGQVSDEDGNPILEGLTLEEKKQVLDCYSTDSRFQAAIAEYCIDDHSFIAETLVTDGGTVIVDEDAALGNSDADLRLDNGTLRIAGTMMTGLSRNVVLDGAGTLDIANAANMVTAPGVISGAGSLTKAGAGALNLTGTSTYTGETFVNGGALFVNGSIATSSLTTVNDGALLGGNGILGSLRVATGGTLSPGNSIGTLTVHGDVTFETGSNFIVEVDADGNADKVVASGTATINGGTMATVAANGNYRADTSYSVLVAGGGVTGAFDNVTTNMAFLTPSFDVASGQLVLSTERNDTPYEFVGTTPNRKAVAAAIDGLGGGALYNAIVGLDAGTADYAFDRLSGDLYPSVMAGLAEDSHFFRDAVSARFAGGIATAPMGDAEASGRFNVWSHAYGAKGQLEGDGIGTLDRNTGGFTFGADADLNETVTLGAMAGYGRSSFDLDGDSADADSYLLGAYGAARFDAFRLTFGGAYAFNSVDSHRSVDFSSFSDNLTASFDGSVGQIFAEAAYAFEVGGGVFEPYLGIAQVHAETDGFTETGGAASLAVQDADMNVTYMDIGLRAAKAFALGERQARFTGEIGWRHAFGDITPDTAMSIAGSTPFTIVGTPVTENAAIVSAGLNFDLTDNANLYVNYVGQFAEESTENGINAGLKVRF